LALSEAGKKSSAWKEVFGLQPNMFIQIVDSHNHRVGQESTFCESELRDSISLKDTRSLSKKLAA